MKAHVEKAINELKGSGEWDGCEERINCEVAYDSGKSPSRALVLIKLHAETPEIILIKLELTSGLIRTNPRFYIEEIKSQIKAYFGSEAHQKLEFPKAFTIREVLRDYPTISNWFYAINQ